MNIRSIASPKRLLLAVLAIALLALLACGSSATTATAEPASGGTTTGGVPTATPQPATAAPAVRDTGVNPGKVVLLMPAWGNERFDNIHTPGGGNNYLKFMHADGVNGDKNGKLIPGIVT